MLSYSVIITVAGSFTTVMYSSKLFTRLASSKLLPSMKCQIREKKKNVFIFQQNFTIFFFNLTAVVARRHPGERQFTKRRLTNFLCRYLLFSSRVSYHLVITPTLAPCATCTPCNPCVPCAKTASWQKAICQNIKLTKEQVD